MTPINKKIKGKADHAWDLLDLLDLLDLWDLWDLRALRDLRWRIVGDSDRRLV